MDPPSPRDSSVGSGYAPTYSETDDPGPSNAMPQQDISAPQDDEMLPGAVHKNQRQKRTRKVGRSQQQELHMKPAQGYRTLLSQMIEEATRRSAADNLALGPSQIGGSFWTSQEKDVFFQSLGTSGSRDLTSLREALPSKNESEILTYISLLRSGLPDTAIETSMAEIPAALEISRSCEMALNATAEALEQQAETSEIQSQQRRNDGSYWLIDREQAEQLESQFEDQQDITSAEDEDLPRHLNGTESSDVSVGEGRFLCHTTAATLLRPVSFLELSREYFMNSSSSNAINWHHPDNTCSTTDEPALLRTAFEDLHAIAVNLTRRLVQVTIFQAMSRLRAQDSSRDDWAPDSSVGEVDVRSASEVLNMPSWHDYWIGLARRCQVDVYSKSRYYADKGCDSKIGRRLEYEEVEAELGLARAASSAKTDDEDEDASLEDDIDVAMADESLFADATDDDAGPENPNSDPGKLQSDSRDSSQPRKRKRASSPSSFYRAENKYLRVLDNNASIEEEKFLWECLDRHPNSGLRFPEKLPAAPGLRPETEHDQGSWRERLDFESEWEQPMSPMSETRFEETSARMATERQRRIKLMEKVRTRINASKARPYRYKSQEDEMLSDSVDVEADCKHEADGSDVFPDGTSADRVEEALSTDHDHHTSQMYRGN